jgi:hypothetical protein
MQCIFKMMWYLPVILLLADLNVGEDAEFITTYVTQETY